jgi:hypothetical protein
MGGGSAILHPQTDEDGSRGVIVVVDPSHAIEFLEFLRPWQEKQLRSEFGDFWDANE